MESENNEVKQGGFDFRETWSLPPYCKVMEEYAAVHGVEGGRMLLQPCKGAFIQDASILLFQVGRMLPRPLTSVFAKALRRQVGFSVVSASSAWTARHNKLCL